MYRIPRVISGDSLTYPVGSGISVIYPRGAAKVRSDVDLPGRQIHIARADTAMLAVVFNLYCPLINRTGLKVVFMFVKDTIWSLFFLKSPEKSIIQLKIK